MSVALLDRPVRPADSPGFVGGVLNALATVFQFVMGWTTLLIVAWAMQRFYRPQDRERRSPAGRLLRTGGLFLLSWSLTLVFFLGLLILSLPVIVLTFLAAPPSEGAPFNDQPIRLTVQVLDVVAFIFALVKLRRIPDYDPDFEVYGRHLGMRVRLWRTIFRMIGTAIVLGLSLLPLSALLLAFPAVAPQESVLTESVTESRSRWRRLLRRAFAIVAGGTVLIALMAVSVEVVTQLPLPEKGQFASIARGFLPAPSVVLGQTERERNEKLEKMPPAVREFMKTPLHEKLPPVMVQHWPFVILTMYLADLLILLSIGKVPLSYNLRNIRVRWVTSLMTALAFTFVIWLLVFLLGFVNGMNNLTENTGIPGNVFVLSEGATDEAFSNLGYGDLDNVERVVVTHDAKDRPLPTPVRVKQVEKDGRMIYLASRETYYVINQPIPGSNPPRRRFVQVRSLEDPWVAQQVHDIELYPGSRWFSSAGVDNQSRIECVLGEGVAATLGADIGKPRLDRGDTFELGDMTWVVVGLMKTEGTTFGSEIWVKRFNRIYQPFGKEKYTTLVMRTDADTKEAATAMAYHLSKRYTQQKLKGFAEPDYYADLTKTNNDFLVAIVVVAIVMAVGGVFGMMTTMFASISQRIRDIGVLRLLGFKRWQVMVSFMLESLSVALIGGALGCLLAWLLVDGRGSTSTLSSGPGSGKSVAITIDIDAQVAALGMLFTLVMGRLGGLVPALSAMRMNVLDSLR